MNKITQLMLKEMTVRLLSVFLLLCLTSCSNKTDNDSILELIIEQNNFSKKDSLEFQIWTNNTEAIAFFKSRNTKNIVFKHKLKDNVKPSKPMDSAYYQIDSLIYQEKPVKGNYYLKKGKGIDHDAELFLKDSFDYTFIDSLQWEVNGKLAEMCKGHKKNKKTLSISKPVYNLDKNKAIVFRIINSENWLDKKIYFLRKKDSEWKVIYTESNN